MITRRAKSTFRGEEESIDLLKKGEDRQGEHNFFFCFEITTY